MYLSNLDKQAEDTIKVTMTHADGQVESHFMPDINLRETRTNEQSTSAKVTMHNP